MHRHRQIPVSLLTILAILTSLGISSAIWIARANHRQRLLAEQAARVGGTVGFMPQMSMRLARTVPNWAVAYEARCLDLSQSEVDDAKLDSMLRLCGGLEQLWLDSTEIGDLGLRSLPHHKRLRWLSLGRTNITDAALKNLSGLDQIEYLDLSSTSLTDAGLEKLGNLPNLTELDLGNTDITNSGVRHLARLGLKQLSLHGTRIDDAALTIISHISTMESLDIGETGVTDVGVLRLRSVRDLHDISLRQTDTTEDVVHILKQRFKNLQVF